jgi:hypothetical protein
VHGRLGSSGGSHRLDRERWSLVVEVGRARPSVAWLRSRRRDKVSRLEGGDEVVELRLLASGGTSDTHAVACSDGSGLGARPLHAIFSLTLRTRPMRRSGMLVQQQRGGGGSQSLDMCDRWQQLRTLLKK